MNFLCIGGLERGGVSHEKYNSPEQPVQDSCNWRTNASRSHFSEEDERVPQEACVENYTALYRLPDSGAASELTVRPPLIPRAVDGQCGPGVLDIDEEHVPVGREGRAGEFGLVHAIVPEAVDLAGGRYAD